LEGLEELKELDQLYLSHNGIKRLEGLENNVNSKDFTFSLLCPLMFFSRTKGQTHHARHGKQLYFPD
jgi:hypothetical protein